MREGGMDASRRGEGGRDTRERERERERESCTRNRIKNALRVTVDCY